LGKSVEEYERLVSLTVGRLFFGDIYAKSFYGPGGAPKMRWLFGENPDIYTFGNYLPARKRKLCIIYDMPEKDK
jgi:hypothetical protein